MTARQLCVVLTLLWASVASSEENCMEALTTLQKERITLTTSLDSEKANVRSLTSTLQEKEAAMQKLSSEREAVTERGVKCDSELEKASTGLKQCGSELEEKSAANAHCESELKIAQGAEKQLQVELANSFARVQVLSAEINQGAKRNSNLEEANAGLKQCGSELEEKSAANAHCESELKIAQGAEKQLQVELANSFARVQVLSAEINQLTKLAENDGKGAKCDAELEKASTGLKQCGSELEEKSKASIECESELKITEGAEKQLQVELANSFARVQILSAEIDQLTKLSDKLKAQVEEKDRALIAVKKTALLAEAELQSLKEKAVASNVAAFMNQLTLFSVEQAARVSPYWQAFKQYMLPFIQAITNSQYSVQAIDACNNVLQQGKDMANKLYADARPFLNQVTETGKLYGSSAANAINEIYGRAKPMIQNSVETILVYGAEAFSLMQKFVVAAMNFVVETSKAIAESQLVADIKRISTETVDELQVYIHAQMQQIASLQPFAKMEYVRFIVLTMLALPPMFILGLLYTCFRGRAPAKRVMPAKRDAPVPAAAQETAPKKSKRKKNKQQGKVVNVGGDVVRYGA